MMVRIVDGCIGCGLCEGTCPNVFCMGEDGKAQVCKQPDVSDENQVQDAADLCPASVIEISKY